MTIKFSFEEPKNMQFSITQELRILGNLSKNFRNLLMIKNRNVGFFQPVNHCKQSLKNDENPEINFRQNL